MREFPTSELSLKYSVLHKIIVKNWLGCSQRTATWRRLTILIYYVGTGTSVNLNDLMFSQIIANAGNDTSRAINPSTIKSQKNMLTNEDMLEPSVPVLCVNPKLFRSKNVFDIQDAVADD